MINPKVLPRAAGNARKPLFSSVTDADAAAGARPQRRIQTAMPQI
jgi:hypothetical protein